MEKDKAAFTLAEVLITLAIIGVVAAMTLPSIIANTQKQEYVSALKKTYSALSQATNMVINEQGGTPDTWGMVDGSDASTNTIMNYYLPHLNNIKNCDSEDSSCDYPTNLLGLNSSISGIQTSWGLGLGSNTFNWTFADGTYLAFDMHANSSPIINYFGVDPGYNNGSAYGIFIVDVNGNKKPNQLGRDAFIFVLTNKGLAPAGQNDNSANCSTTTSSVWSGADCTAKVIKEGAENY